MQRTPITLSRRSVLAAGLLGLAALVLGRFRSGLFRLAGRGRPAGREAMYYEKVERP